MVGKSTFQQDWLNPDLNPEFAKWARAGRDRSSVFCEICNKSFDISSMGKQALSSHSKSLKHSRLMNGMTIFKKIASVLCAKVLRS